MTLDGAAPGSARVRPGLARAVLAGVLLVAWLAWPFLGYGALITATPFFGELPTPQEEATSAQLALTAIGVGVLGPVAAFVLAGRGSASRTVAVAECALTLAAVALFLVVAMR